ncbi:lipopolysaccharide biosynthesis protein [Rhodoferax sp.]|uniref:lipopolysaccharide biosynthesis protein n=1 Tax=Rhodoferax sp. TaxID=50421 RepID=UPI002726C76B|nr:lipopolysaccharide biosynthesis protein [Rhodoferax sp.]MDO9195018.1 lipopolysaccharide biosynthesis protein [Rhodoferax sp.]
MSTRKSLFFSFLDRYASLLISVASSMVIARLLTPAEIGVFSVTMVLLMFVATVRDMGAGQYLLQEKELTTERIRAVWAVQLGLGVGLACIVLLASHPVALFYNEPRMRDIMLVVALNYAINPFGSLTYAWLMREMQFESVALMRFSAGLSGALASIWLAWQGYGPISLAIGSLTSTVVNALIAVYFRPKSFPWLPGVREIRRVLVFGSKLTASSIVGVLSGSAPELLLGKLQGLAAAGLYSRSSGLVQMFHRLFVDAVGAVCMPWFARQSREQGSFVDPFLKATAYVTAFGWSFCLAVICLAHPIVRVLYGDQWDQSVDLARLLAVATAFGVPAALCGTALLSSGGVTIIARVTVFSAIQSIAFVALGASQGLAAMGLALIAASAVSAVLWLRATARHIGMPLSGLLNTLRQSAQVALLAVIGPALALWIYGPYPAVFVMPLILGGAGGLAGFLLGIVIFKHPLQVEITTILSKIRQPSI